MAIEITIPRLDWNMEEGIFAGWLKRDGETVKAGESLFTLESDKATQDIECLDSGILRLPPDGPKEGAKLAVGAVIGYLVQAGESVPFESKSPALASGRTVPLALPARDEMRKSPGASAAKPQQRQSRPISPRARRVASELGVDWQQLQGGGRTGRIRERDVRAAASGSYACSPARGEEIRITAIRRTIAERMMESRQCTAPVTLTTTVDATNLVNLRNQFKASAVASEVVPGYMDILVKLTAVALRDHPALNARWEGDRLVLFHDIHIGIAVDTPAGLYVPVVRNVSGLSLKQIAARAKDLIDRAGQRKLLPEEMKGSTFTLTNLGAFGIDAFTPIVNFPECAILGIGRIQRQPVAREDQIVVREQLTLSLTFDHRIIDGAPAARFLQSLGKLIENPGPCLMSSQ